MPTEGEILNYVKRQPLGVVVQVSSTSFSFFSTRPRLNSFFPFQIAPFNHPLLIAVKKIAPALAAGNSVIVKPSEFVLLPPFLLRRVELILLRFFSRLTPLTLLEFGLLATKAGIPDGVLCILPGEGRTVGKELVVDRRVKKIDLTACPSF